jgi:hypothetical protein
MAKYKEIRDGIGSAIVIAYRDTETGICCSIDPGNSEYQAFLEWQTAGGVPDPAYTAEEIAAAVAAETAAEASSYVASTSNQTASYTERKAAGLPGKINSLKFKHLRRRRGLALGRV